MSLTGVPLTDHGIHTCTAFILPKVSSSPDASTQRRRGDLDVVGRPSTRCPLSHRLGVTCLSVVSADPTRPVAVVIYDNSHISSDQWETSGISTALDKEKGELSAVQVT